MRQKDAVQIVLSSSHWSKDTIFSEKVYEDNYFLKDDYRNRTDYTLKEIVDEYSINREDHYLLNEYCKKVGIDFNSTPFSKSEVDLLVDELDVPFIKIASMDLNNIPFLTYVAGRGKPVVISTGLCGLADVSDAVECLQKMVVKKLFYSTVYLFILLQTTWSILII